ncbi:MAG TPA: hypothetical protein VFW02_09300, partial [Candidatus Limnocylindrales bacterium]|nr:hypothetical protein [Candidatus Limnocylindrales bacterium]
LLVADVRRRTGDGPERREVIRLGMVGLGLIVLSFVPLVIHELTTDFAEVDAALAYLRAGGEPPSQGPLGRFVFIGLRVVSWPLVGLVADGVTAAVLSLVAVGSIAVWRSVAVASAERTAVRWLALGLVWTALALTFVSPSLAVVVRGLPNDHYHAFADPMVFVLVGIGAAALWRAVPQTRRGVADGREADAERGDGREARLGGGNDPGLGAGDGRSVAGAATPGRVIAVVGMLAIVAWAATHLPPAIHPDGGFPGAVSAAGRIEAAAGSGPIELRSLPDFKSVEAYAYPLVIAGRHLEMGAEVSEATLTRVEATATDAGSLVVICDALFEPVLGAACGGPAEASIVPAALGDPIDRFDASPGRVISVYRVGR